MLNMTLCFRLIPKDRSDTWPWELNCSSSFPLAVKSSTLDAPIWILLTLQIVPLFFSDPLEGSVFLVSGPNDEDDEVGKSGVFEEVMKGLHYGTKESLGCAAEMVNKNMVGLAVVRFFDGYCGWEKEQLQKEIRAEYWTVAACSSAIIGLESEVVVGFARRSLG
ncbi:hypothetical protein Cgig2_018448 [Carnegiea gigantea]|uniref:Uncharacterized protein n=1 Tax=Carnegiea gigantea TaxID=171969 RepID=A0A9Q1JGB5_9CARY|nr:hypothetical protein Cgig2_018448 [Carnegiea gigantea]